MQKAGGHQHRAAHIAPRADHHIGMEIPDDFRCLAHRQHCLAGPQEICQAQMVLEALQVYNMKGQALLRHYIGLQAPARTYIKELCLGPQGPQLMYQGDGRVDMSPRATTGNYDFQNKTSLKARLPDA